MSAPFEMLSRDFIKKWLLKLIDRHGERKHRPGVTMDCLARYMQIPVDSLRALALRDTSCLSVNRQRYFSKVIAMIENGQLVFEKRGKIKVGVIVDKAQPIRRYRVEFGTGHPVLKAVGRPAPFNPPPTFKSLTLKT